MNKEEKVATLQEVWDEVTPQQKSDGPVVCLGKVFANDAERQIFYRDELRKKIPELINMEGFPIANIEDIVNLSDPPYYTACPNPWLNELVDESKNTIVESPYIQDLSADEKNPVYSFHPYHTKVPPSIIETLIRYYTNEGDVVLDVFSGSGMTGVAARACNRKVILNDLSPIASFISGVNTTSYDYKKVLSIMSEISKQSQDKYGYLYRTHKNGKEFDANYFVWTDVFTCPECIEEIPFFPYGVVHHGNKVETKKEFFCPNCGVSLNVCKVNRITTGGIKKKKLVWVNAGTGKTRLNMATDQSDEMIVQEAINILINDQIKYPKDMIDPAGYSAKLAQLGDKCITDVSRFLSERNLIIFADLFERVNKIEDNIVKNECRAILTSIFTVISERQGYFGGGGGMSGNLYMPIVRMEKNIYMTLDRKLKKLKDIENSKPQNHIFHMVSTQSSTNMPNIISNTIDYIYIDPPFGSNIIYSEMNLLLESWLGIKTNNGSEAVINPSTNKDFFCYNQLMIDCFSECFRVLKPNHWMTVEFHNSKASIWNLIQNALSKVGFVISHVSKLDKHGTTILADIREGAVVQDLIISCYKPGDSSIKKDVTDNYNNVWGIVDDFLAHLPICIIKDNVTSVISERTARILYDRIIAYYLQSGQTIPIDAADFYKELKIRYLEKDGMYFTANQLSEYEDKKKLLPGYAPMGIIVSDEANGIQWIHNELGQSPQTYQDLYPKWILALKGKRKGDIIPELRDILDENFIKDDNGVWRNPDIETQKDREIVRTNKLLKEFKKYVELIKKSSKLKDFRREALRAGFKQCYLDKDFQTIVYLGNKLPEDLLTEDEVLLQYYDIASSRV